MSGHATCDVCERTMDQGVGCTATHVGKSENGPWVPRIVFGGEPEDWGVERGHCNDCNAGVGQPHHDGCDVERCPECGAQMLMCLGEPGPEEAAWEREHGVNPCHWTHLATLPPTEPAAADDPVVKVLWKDEGDFGFISMVRLSEMSGHDPSTPWLEVIASKRDAGEDLGVPFDPNRKRPAGTRREAKALAREHNAVYEEV